MRLLLRVLISVGLAIDAYVHLVTASAYDAVGDTLTQGDLFRIEAAVAGVAAVLILFLPHRATFAFAFVVAVSAFGAVVLYRYVDVGALGPLPNMYEPVWTMDKIVSAVAEGVAAGLALLGLVWRQRLGGRPPA